MITAAMMITAMTTITVTKFLILLYFDCFYKGLSPKKDGPFLVDSVFISPKGHTWASAQKLSLMSHSG
jgi:hypothetical protein